MSEKDECPSKVAARGRQLVVHSQRPPGVRAGQDDGVPLQALKAGRKDVRRDPGDVFLQVVEAARTTQKRLDDLERPAITYERDGFRQGTPYLGFLSQPLASRECR